MTWIFKCDRCGEKSLSEEGIPRRDGEYAATVVIKLAIPEPHSEHPESNELCVTCHKNLYVWFDNLDVNIPRYSNVPPPNPDTESSHGPT